MGKPKDAYTGRTSVPVEIDGVPFQATVHWAIVGGRARCVGVDLRSFTSKNSARADLSDARPVGGGWAEITSPVMRGLRVAEVIAESKQDTALLQQMVAALPAVQRRALGAPVGQTRGKPGPRSRWTDELLREVVAPAYRLGGRQPAKAVQEALEKRLGELITRDMARKAVARARVAGYLPPHERGDA